MTQRRPVWILLALSLALPLANVRGDARQEAEAAWAKRAEPGERERAITLWQKALRENPEHTEVLTRLAQATGSAYRNATDPDEKRRWADLGLHYGQEAAAKNPESAEAYARYGEALGQWAQAHKGLKGLRRVKDAVAALNKAVALDPHHWFSHMLLAEFYREAPASISIGDKTKALEEGKRAVETAPDVPLTHVTLAKTFLAAGRKDNAVQELKAALASPGRPDSAPETRTDKESARRLLQELGVKDLPSASAAWPASGHACRDSSECSGACLAGPRLAAGQSASGICSDAPVAPESCQSTVKNGKVITPACKE